jgi:hypothetical protein
MITLLKEDRTELRNIHCVSSLVFSPIFAPNPGQQTLCEQELNPTFQATGPLNYVWDEAGLDDLVDLDLWQDLSPIS